MLLESLMVLLFANRCGLDSPKPTVDLEDPILVSKLFSLFHGTPADSTLAADNKARLKSQSDSRLDSMWTHTNFYLVFSTQGPPIGRYTWKCNEQYIHPQTDSAC